MPAFDVHRGVVQAVTSGTQGGEELGECLVRAVAGGGDRFVSGVGQGAAIGGGGLVGVRARHDGSSGATGWGPAARGGLGCPAWCGARDSIR